MGKYMLFYHEYLIEFCINDNKLVLVTNLQKREKKGRELINYIDSLSSHPSL